MELGAGGDCKSIELPTGAEEQRKNPNIRKKGRAEEIGGIIQGDQRKVAKNGHRSAEGGNKLFITTK